MSEARQTADVPPSPTATPARTALVTALELAALVLALVFTDAPVWAAAAVTGGAITGTLVRERLLPRPEWWAIALIPVAMVLCGFAAIGVEETFSARGAHEYEAIANVRLASPEAVAKASPTELENVAWEIDECPGDRACLSDGDAVEVVCFRELRKGGPSWAKLDLEEYPGAYVLAQFLASKGEPAPTCGDTGTPEQ